MAAAPFALSLEELPGPACWLAAPEGRVAEHNARFAAWAGGDAAGATLGELFPGDPALGALWEEARAAGLAEHHVARRGPDGAPSFWNVRAQRTRDGVLVCAADLGAFAAAARALHGIQAGYVTAATHEARAPLAAIKAWASALLSRRRGEPMAEDGLTAIVRQVDRMNDLLSDLFEAARSSSSALASMRAPIPVRDLVERALAASPHPVDVTVDFDPGAHDLVLVDAAHIEAALLRVIAVAARRAPSGPLALAVARDRDEIAVRLADPGPPLSPAAEATLFARSARAAPARTLHAARLLAAASGARLFHDPEAGCFVLALPTARSAAPRAPGPLRIAASLRPDGDREVRAAAVLKLHGHHVVTASIEEALSMESVDVLLLDATLAGPGAAPAELADRRGGRLLLVTVPPAAPMPAISSSACSTAPP